jgi:hypothetical protein
MPSDLLMDGHSARGFLLPSSDMKPSGDAYVFIDYWMNPSREGEVKMPRGGSYQLQSDPAQSVPQWWQIRFSPWAARGWRSNIGRLNKEWHPQPISLGFNWEEDTRAWKDAKRMRSRLGFYPAPVPKKRKALWGRRKTKGIKGGEQSKGRG